MWKVHYAISSSGKSWVQQFLNSLNPTLQAQVIRQLQKIAIGGPYIGPPVTKKIDRRLYELRIIGRQQIRILFTVTGHKIILVHAVIKKSSKLSRKDINTARQRIDN